MGAVAKTAALLFISALLGGGALLVNPAARALFKDEVRTDEIPIAAASWLGANALWVDARSRAAFDAGHVEGALLLNEDEWSALLLPVVERWKPGMPVVVYCDSEGCQASRKVADRLREEAGIESVKVLVGDWKNVRLRK